MSAWTMHNYKVQIYNGNIEKSADWHELNRYADKTQAENRARKQSSIYPEDLYRVYQTYWDDIWEEYFMGGKSLGIRQYVRRNDEKMRNWIGINIPALPSTQKIFVENFEEYTSMDWLKSELDIYRFPVAMNIFTKNNYANKRMRRVTVDGGAPMYFYYGEQITEEVYSQWMKNKLDRLEIKKSYILPEDTNVSGSITFEKRTFQTPSIVNVVSNLDMLVRLFDAVNAETGNTDIAYITNQLHVALENITNEVVNRDEQGSATGD